MPKNSTSSHRTSYKAPRRGKFEIWSALLEACLRTPRTQSWLMRKVYLNTAAAKDALSILIKGELLEQLRDPTEGIFEFKTTEKGKAALAQYYQLITYFFETKQKRSSLHYIILPLLLNLPRLSAFVDISNSFLKKLWVERVKESERRKERIARALAYESHWNLSKNCWND